MLSAAVEHAPVLLKETLRLLSVRKGGVYVDCTVGLGGHAQAILDRLDGSGQLIGLDRDESALKMAGRRLAESHSNFSLYNENFKNLPLVLNRLEIAQVDGILVDLGVSSLQLDTPERGFSFRFDAPLDMRMDQQGRTTAAQLVNSLDEKRLAEILRLYGEEPRARRIAAEIVRRRRRAPLRTTGELAELVVKVKGARPGRRIHPATRVFQALRIEVNQELAGLEEFLDGAVDLLKAGGRLAVISFHSLEDRTVKKLFRAAAGRCVCFRPGDLCICPRIERVRILTPKPMLPDKEETQRNPRSRSAKLRAVERTAPD